jgi:hypothetical protein
MFSKRTGSNGGFVKAVTGSGTPAPVASTGISSYFSKLMPVCCLDGSVGSPKSSFSIRGLRGPTTWRPLRQAPNPEESRCWLSPRGSLAVHPLLDGRPAQSLALLPPRMGLLNPMPKAVSLPPLSGGPPRRGSNPRRGEAWGSFQPVLGTSA